MRESSVTELEHPLLPNRHNPGQRVPRDNPDQTRLISCQVLYLYAAAEIQVTLHPRANSQPKTYRFDADEAPGQVAAMFTLLNSAMLGARRVDAVCRTRADGEAETLLAVALALE